MKGTYIKIADLIAQQLAEMGADPDAFVRVMPGAGNVGSELWAGRWAAMLQVRTPVTVYKKLRHELIGTLILLPGELVRIPLIRLKIKCRTSAAFVQSINSGVHSYHKGTSFNNYQYTVGTVATPGNGWPSVDWLHSNEYFELEPKECASGIHFFFKRRHAKEWRLPA
jgi:hypothetical protein